MNTPANKIAVTAAIVFLSACGSPPKPAEPDGSSRVAANDTSRVLALQERVAQDRAILTENNKLKSDLDALKAQLDEMRSIVRSALSLPPVVPKPVVTMPAPTTNLAPFVKPSAPTSRVTPLIPTTELSAQEFEKSNSRAVFRVFHPFAKTTFEPSATIAQALREVAPGAKAVEVKGMTDSNNINPYDKMIAIERAERARQWLVQNGVESSKIRIRYFSAGNFLTTNATAEGRALNRRVEIDLRGV